MRAAGVPAATPDPEGGRVLRDAAGNPTGVFIDGAMALIDSKVPPPSPELRKARVVAAAQAIAANGLTEMHDAGAEQATITAIQQLIDEHKFPIRVYLMLTDEPALLDSWFARKPLIGYGDRLTVRSVKMYADGALGSRGAALGSIPRGGGDRRRRGVPAGGLCGSPPPPFFPVGPGPASPPGCGGRPPRPMGVGRKPGSGGKGSGAPFRGPPCAIPAPASP